MGYVIGLIVAAICVALVAAPFYQRCRKSQEPEVMPSSLEAQDKRRRIYQEMDTVQMDYDMGNIDKTQYEQQMQTYRLEAASIIRVQQKHGQKDVGVALEDEVKAYRTARTSGKPIDSCPNCGFITSHGEKVCPLCNQSLASTGKPKDGNS